MTPDDLTKARDTFRPSLDRAAHYDAALVDRAWSLYVDRCLAGDSRATPLVVLQEVMKADLVAALPPAPGRTAIHSFLTTSIIDGEVRFNLQLLGLTPRQVRGILAIALKRGVALFR